MLLASGIFRDVYVLYGKSVRLWDFRVNDDAHGFGIDLEFCGESYEDCKAEVTLDGKTQSFDVADKVSCRFDLENPKLWNCEEPNLYRLTITLKHGDEVLEIHSKKIGILSSEVKDGKVLVQRQSRIYKRNKPPRIRLRKRPCDKRCSYRKGASHDKGEQHKRRAVQSLHQ